MNKFTYASFSVFIALLLAIIMFLNFTVKVIAGTAIMIYLIATMIKMVFVITFRKANDQATVIDMNERKMKYA
jgi:glucan phosphoethanolaminetransferase (alkaline phosphatase superfamily)